jgi:peroxiredoxin (alkyl hydroperoxide reductase subunit C)
MRKWMLLAVIFLAACAQPVTQQSNTLSITDEDYYYAGELKAMDSSLKVQVGDQAPEFTLPTLYGKEVSLGQYLNRKNVLITFVPAAWTPVCSAQWPSYHGGKQYFDRHDTVILGITVDNLPTLFTWTRQMGGLWFPILSDFWPHGEVADRYGVLRSDGMTERALFLIDKQGIIRYIDVHDINESPDLDVLVKEMDKLNKMG